MTYTISREEIIRLYNVARLRSVKDSTLPSEGNRESSSLSGDAIQPTTNTTNNDDLWIDDNDYDDE